MNKNILIALFIFGMSTSLNAKEIRFECFYADYKEYFWSNRTDEWKRHSPDTVGGTTVKVGVTYDTVKNIIVSADKDPIHMLAAKNNICKMTDKKLSCSISSKGRYTGWGVDRSSLESTAFHKIKEEEKSKLKSGRCKIIKRSPPKF